MDPRELIGDFEEFLRLHFRRYQSGIWTALPLVVNQWNYPTNGKNTVHATPGITGRARQQDGTWKNQPMPVLPDIPVHYLGGGGFFLTHPIAKDDEGIGIFSSRALDGWWQNGGANAPRPDYAETVMHDLSDCMFIPTRMSDKNKLANISQTSTQLRSTDGKSYIEILPGGAGFNWITPDGYVKFDGKNLRVSGNIFWNDKTASTDAAGHKHGSVTTGPDETGTPVPGT